MAQGLHSMLSKTQIDKLGKRLRDENPTDTDLLALEEFRLSFGAAYEEVVETIRTELGVETTGRPAKTTDSIVQKLRRGTLSNLSQMQDIAGCRITVPDVASQDAAVTAISGMFVRARIVDRRQDPSHGYRAVHIITPVLDRPVEIQIRTGLQHEWAQMSERYSDDFGIEVKYGGGPEIVKSFLSRLSEAIAAHEVSEKDVSLAIPASIKIK